MPVTWFTAPDICRTRCRASVDDDGRTGPIWTCRNGSRAVEQRPRAAELSAEQLRELPVARKLFGVLQAVAHAHDHVRVRDSEIRVERILPKRDRPAPDLIFRKVYALFYALDFRLLSGRRVFKRAGTDRRHLRPQLGHRDDRHDFAANRGLDELNVAALGVIHHLDASTCSPCSIAPRSAARSRARSSSRPRIRRMVIFPAQHGEQIRVSVVL